LSKLTFEDVTPLLFQKIIDILIVICHDI